MPPRPVIVFSPRWDPSRYVWEVEKQAPGAVEWIAVEPRRAEWALRRLEPAVVHFRTSHVPESQESRVGLELEELMAGTGARVVNPPTGQLRAQRKDLVYSDLRALGCPVPRVFGGLSPSPDTIAKAFEEVAPAPLVLRTLDGLGGGDGMFLVRNLEDASTTIAELRRREIPPELLLVEYLGAPDSETFVRHRIHVVGDRIDMCQKDVGRGWVVCRGTLLEATMVAPPPGLAAVLEPIHRAYRLELYAADFVSYCHRQGSCPRHVLVDVNPTYKMSPEPHLYGAGSSQESHFARVVRFLEESSRRPPRQ